MYLWRTFHVLTLLIPCLNVALVIMAGSFKKSSVFYIIIGENMSYFNADKNDRITVDKINTCTQIYSTMSHKINSIVLQTPVLLIHLVCG